jgi:uncharacterized protein (TIGR03435 family)
MLFLFAISPAATSFAQTSTSGPTAAVPGTGVAATSTAVTFEVSAIKLNKSGNSGSSSNMHDGRFTASNVTLKNVLQYQAYAVPESRILGGPKWLGSERFDIDAKMDSAAAEGLHALANDERRKQTRAMFQQMLADRFKLAAHWEMRDLPVYALVVTKKGPSFQRTKEPDGHTGTSSNNGQFNAHGLTMAQLADALTQELSKELGRPVIDKTGIQGRYDFALKWTPETDADVGTNSAVSPDSGPSIFTAIQEQMGLKLESTKGPVQVLVIDHVEMPTEN